MAKITILEQDLTTAGSSSATDNVVYVPGYATMGPVNEPTLCSTLQEFQSIFGITPYRFIETQVVDSTNVALAGDYEKSYWYAAELLKSGLPVLFERVATVTNYAESDITVNEYNYTIDYKQTTAIFNVDIKSTATADQYEFETTLKPTTTNISIETSTGTVNIPTATITEASGKFKVTFTYTGADTITGVRKVTYTLNTALDFEITGTNNITNSSITWSITHKTTGTPINVELENVKLYNGNFSADIKQTGGVITDLIINSDNLVKVTNTVVNSNTLNTIKIKAKYPGKYAHYNDGDGLGLTVTITKTADDLGNYIYKLVPVLTTINGELTEDPIKVSLDETADNYIKYAKSSLLSFEDCNVNRSFVLNKLIDLTPGVYKFAYSGDMTADEFTINDFYSELQGTQDKVSILEKLTDRDEYQIKFITTGSYPIVDVTGKESIVTTALRVAGTRGDALALIDHKDEDPLTLYDNVNNTLKTRITTDGTQEEAKKYGAMFTPWAKYQLQTANVVVDFPASYAYLRCLAASTRTNAIWNAVSGVTRGQVPNILSVNKKVTGAIAEKLQSREGISINPITNIKPYGYCIWGNRTLFNNIDDLTASSFLNIRMLTGDVKKVVYAAAKKMVFELNSDVLWLNFKSAIEPTLDKMVSGNGLSNYKLIKVPTNKKATLACKIRLFAIEAVEDWDITVELADSYTSIE